MAGRHPVVASFVGDYRCRHIGDWAVDVVKPLHEKAMPVMLLTTGLFGSAADALELQKPASDAAIVVLPSEKKAA